MNISFYKKNNSWFADLPEYIAQGGTEASCVMVAGADTLLDKLAVSPNAEYITLDISPFKVSENHNTHILLDRVESVSQEFLDEHNHPLVEFGGNYTADMIDNEPTAHKLWLCPVTLFVFPSGYPKELWISVEEVMITNNEKELQWID